MDVLTTPARGSLPRGGRRRLGGPTGLGAVVHRERVLLTHNRTNLLLTLVPTIVYLLLFATSLARLVRTVHYRGALVDYPEFAVPAIILSSMLAASAATGMSLFQEELGGMAVELWSYPLRRSAYIGGKLLATTVLVAAQSLGMLLLGYLLFPAHRPVSHWLALCVAVLIASLMFNALYLFLAALIHDFQRFTVLINVLGPLLLFSSPSFYPVEQMPAALRWCSAASPATYAIDCLRDAAIFGFCLRWTLTATGLLAAAAILVCAMVGVLHRRTAAL